MDNNRGDASLSTTVVPDMDPLGEVCFHMLDLIQESLPSILKRVRVALFKNPMGVPIAGLTSPFHQWIFQLLMIAEASLGAVRKHMELSTMDRLRACQTVYATFRSSKETVNVLAQADLTKKEMTDSLDELLATSIQSAEEAFKSMKEILTDDDVSFFHDLAAGLRAFYDVADMLGGDAVFMPKPDPRAVAKLAGLVGGTVPQVCPIHPPVTQNTHYTGKDGKQHTIRTTVGSPNIIMNDDAPIASSMPRTLNEINITDAYAHKLPPFDDEIVDKDKMHLFN